MSRLRVGETRGVPCTVSPTRGVSCACPAACLPWLAAAGVGLTAVGLLWGLFFAPADWQQGDAVRIMYVHVPAAWLASAGYLGLALCSVLSLVWRHPLADLAAVEIGPVGAGFTALCLLTGSIWGKPMWGAWWVWDARLTSVLVLFFLYLGHIALVRAFDDPVRGYRSGAILALVGVVNLPIIKFSVDWWNTLHQPATISFTGAPTMYVGMLWPLLFAAVGYTLRVRRHRRGAHARRGDGAAHPCPADGACRGDTVVTHLPYIVAAYALGVLIPASFARGGVPAHASGAAPARRHRPQAARAMTRKRRRLWILLACGLGLGSATALALFAFRDNLVFFLAPSDLAGKAPPSGPHVPSGRPGRAGQRAALDR